MILSHLNLRAAVESDEIAFDPPLEESQWGEASIDLWLGFSFALWFTQRHLGYQST
jgi:hypothetical protein